MDGYLSQELWISVVVQKGIDMNGVFLTKREPIGNGIPSELGIDVNCRKSVVSRWPNSELSEGKGENTFGGIYLDSLFPGIYGDTLALHNFPSVSSSAMSFLILLVAFPSIATWASRFHLTTSLPSLKTWTCLGS